MRVSRLGEVAAFIRGVTFKPEDVVTLGTPGSIGCFRTKNVQTHIDLEDVWAIPRSLVKSPEKILRHGDLLVSTANSWNLVGKCSWVPKLDYDATIGGFISALRVESAQIDQRYLFHWFNSARTQLRVRNCAQQTTNIANLSLERCLNIEIPLPPLDEQKRMAAMLDQADELRENRHKVLSLLEKLPRATFVEMFGDPVTNPKGWPRKTISEIGRVITGNTPPRSNASYYGTEIEWIKSDNINTPDYYLTKAKEGLSILGKAVGRTAPADSILVTCIAGTPECIGNAALADREVAFNQQINAFIPQEGEVHFLYGQILVGKRLIQQASTGGMKGLVSKSRFEAISLIFPPASLQQEFAAAVLAIEELKSAHCSSLAKLNALFASLEHRVFPSRVTSERAATKLAMAG